MKALFLKKWGIISIIFGFIYLLMFLFLKNYFVVESTTILGILIFPFLIKTTDKTVSYRYVPWAILMGIFGIYLPVKSLFFFTSILCSLVFIEIWVGKTNHLPLFLLFLLSPMLIYFRSILGISIRFQLSEIAGNLLKLSGLDIGVFGNTIHYQGDTFSIDPACMGLSMLTHSFLLGLFIMAYFQNTNSKFLPFYKNILLLLALLLLNMISNLSRIVLLILFKIYPELIAHDIIGILCLIIYILLPFYFLCQWVYSNNQESSQKITESTSSFWLKTSVTTIIFIGLLIQGYLTKNHFDSFKLMPKYCKIENCKKEQATKDVLKFSNDTSLIYVKPIPHFYSAEHNPLICWNGSGYHFKKITIEKIAGIDVYVGVLQKENESPFYSAWWFDNGNHKTIYQWDWRMNALKTKTNYALINVNVMNKKLLKKEVEKLLQENIFE